MKFFFELFIARFGANSKLRMFRGATVQGCWAGVCDAFDERSMIGTRSMISCEMAPRDGTAI